MKTHLTCLLAAAALLLGSILPATAADQTATWNNTTGNWSDPTKWSTNPLFPNNGNGGFTFDAIQNGGILTVDQAITIEKFNFTGGSNTGAGFTLTTNDLFTFSGGSMGGSGTVNANGGATFSGAADKDLTNTRVLNLSGTSTWSGGAIRFLGGTLVNTVGGDFTTNFDGTTTSLGGTNTIANAGTFTKSAGAGTTTISSGVTFNNTGTVNVNSGTLSLNGGGTHSGTLSAGSGGILRFAGGTHNLNAGTSLSGAGTISLTSGTVTVNAAVASAASTTFNMSGGTLNGAGTLTLGGPLTFSGGSMGGSGTTNANGGATFSGAADKDLANTRVLNLSGTSTWSGGAIRFFGGSLVNTASSVFTTNFDGTMSLHLGGSFSNAGTFTKSAGAGTTTMAVPFTNTGTVNANSGTLNLNGGVTQHSGSTLNGGTWNVTGGSTLNINTGSNITTLGSGASVTLDGAGSTFARFTTALNNNQGSFTLKNNRDLTTAGAFTNSGTMTVQDSTTVMTVNGSYTQTAGSTILSNGGTIMLSTNLNLNGGELRGEGTVSGNVITGGTTTIAPGESPGTLTINGNLTLGSGNTLAMEIGGLTQGSLYDYLDVNGVITLAGLLDIDFINLFQNTVHSSHVFTLATANSAILGGFSNVASGGRVTTNTQLSFEVWYGAGSLYGENNLVVTGVPEPSRALLIILGIGGVMLRRKRLA